MLTIGIPAYNEGLYIEELLEKLARLPYRVIISDNASTDNTELICKKYSNKYKNIEYYSHLNKLSVFDNFKFCLDNASTEFYMLLGGHDLIEEKYIEELLKLIQNNEDVALAYSDVKYFDHVNKIYNYNYKELLVSDRPEERILALIRNLSDCSLQYGIFRTEILQKSFRESFDYLDSISSDHVWLCNVAKYGIFVHTDKVRFLRRQNRPLESSLDSTVRYLKYYYKEKITLENIYHDYLEGMRKGQLDAISNVKIDDSIYKNTIISMAKESLKQRYSSRIRIDDYILYLLKYKEKHKKSLFNSYLCNKKIAIFGTGKVADLLYNELSDLNKVTYFIDNNTKGMFNGIKIIEENEIYEHQEEIDLIIISIEGAHDLKIIKELSGKFDIDVVSWKNYILFERFNSHEF